MNDKDKKPFRVFSNCQEYSIPIWQCPAFLFSVMGIINVTSCLFFYFLGGRYIKEPSMLAIIILGIATFMFFLAYAVTRSVEKLMEINRNKTEFIKIVSHQLRAPLTNIRWSIDFVMSNRKGKTEVNVEKEKDYFELIKENSQRLEDLLSDLLIVNRLNEENFFKYKEDVNFVDVIKETLQDYKYLAKASNVEIITRVIDKPVYVFANKILIETAFENLVKNSIIFNKQGGKVEISLFRHPKEILVAVKDEGPGIPKADRKYIFQRFFRGSKAFHTQTQGTGLGLYIAKAVITKHGGKIWFKTKEGQGTTFFITLPMRKI